MSNRNKIKVFSIVLSCLLAIAAISTPYVSAAPGESLPLSSAERSAMLNAHNHFRSIVKPPAQYMETLEWDTQLESIAQNYVVQCIPHASLPIVAHNLNRANGYPGGSVGENIYATSSSVWVNNMTRVVDSWDSEKADYDLGTNKCKTGRVCGHYTQVVWANTTKVGCGRARCPEIQYSYNVVCNYARAGNVIGVRPYVAKTANSAQGVHNGQQAGNVALLPLFVALLAALLM